MRTVQYDPDKLRHLFVKKKVLTLDAIKEKYGRVDEITLYSGRKIKGVILKYDKTYKILTTKGILRISAEDVESKRNIR